MTGQFWLGALAGGCVSCLLALGLLTMSKGDVLARLVAGPQGMAGNRASLGSDLTDQDRAQVAEEFRIHADAVQRAVSDYADHLADGDPVLRARLRRFEAGER